MNMPTNRFRASGLSLIELLVAVAIGAILMGGAISLFINNRATYELTNDMARLQESARFALQMMTEDIRMAGYVGCVNDVTKVNDNVGLAEGALANFSHGIEGIEAGDASWSPSGYTGLAGSLVAGSDGITVRYLDGDMERDGSGDMNNEVVNQSPDDANPTNTQILVRSLTHTLVSGQAAAIADCGGVDLFTLTAAPGTVSGNDAVQANNLQRSYEELNRAIVAPFVGVRYHVQLNNANVPALFRTTVSPTNPANETTVELVDGVQSLQLLYGVDSDQDGLPNEFLSAGETSATDPTIKLTTRNDYLSVVAVKIALLLETVDEFGQLPPETRDAVFDVGTERFCRAGLVVAPACTRTFPQDNRRRRVFQTTVAVRNFQ